MWIATSVSFFHQNAYLVVHHQIEFGLITLASVVMVTGVSQTIYYAEVARLIIKLDCDYTCFTCENRATRCTSCSSGSHRYFDNVNFQCFCDNGYYNDGISLDCK